MHPLRVVKRPAPTLAPQLLDPLDGGPAVKVYTPQWGDPPMGRVKNFVRASSAKTTYPPFTFLYSLFEISCIKACLFFMHSPHLLTSLHRGQLNIPYGIWQVSGILFYQIPSISKFKNWEAGRQEHALAIIIGEAPYRLVLCLQIKH